MSELKQIRNDVRQCLLAFFLFVYKSTFFSSELLPFTYVCVCSNRCDAIDGLSRRTRTASCQPVRSGGTFSSDSTPSPGTGLDPDGDWNVAVACS